MNTKKSSAIFVRLILILMAVGSVYLVLFTFFTSLKSKDEFYTNLWSFPKTIRFENYIEAFKVGHIGDYFFNSVVIAAVSLLGVTFIGVFAAYALARLKVPFEGAIVGVLLVLQILPIESMIIPLYMMLSKLSILKITYLPIILPYTGWLLPGCIVILRNFFKSIPNELLESARIDGCNELNTMFKVIIPLSGGAIATCTVFNFAFVWGELMWAQIATLTAGIGLPLSVGLINFQGQYETNWGLLTAGIFIVLMPLILLFIFLQKYFIKGLTSGAVKG